MLKSANIPAVLIEMGYLSNPEQEKLLLSELDKVEKDSREITRVFLRDNSVKQRLCGVGVLSRQDAYDLGCVGPTLRASGIDQDMRKLGYAVQEVPVELTTRQR